MKWLFLGGFALWALSKRSATTTMNPQQPQGFVPQKCSNVAGMVTWTGGKVGSGVECITVEEAVKRSDAIYKPMWDQGIDTPALLPGKLSGEGYFWFR